MAKKMIVNVISEELISYGDNCFIKSIVQIKENNKQGLYTEIHTVRKDQWEKEKEQGYYETLVQCQKTSDLIISNLIIKVNKIYNKNKKINQK